LGFLRRFAEDTCIVLDAVSTGEVTGISKDLSAFILSVKRSITTPALHG